VSVLREIAGGVKSILQGMRVTLGYFTRKKVTLQYPEQRPVLSERFRGIPALPVDPATGRDRCVACSACARVCPVNVIDVTMEKDEDNKRHAGEFTLDAGRCIFCGLCVEVCPTGALVMSDEFELAHSSRADLVLGLERLREIGGEFPEKPAEEETPAPAESPEQASTAQPGPATAAPGEVPAAPEQPAAQAAQDASNEEGRP